MKARLSATCGICGRAMCRLESKTLGPIMCENKECTEYHRQYEPPTMQLTPVHAKGK